MTAPDPVEPSSAAPVGDAGPLASRRKVPWMALLLVVLAVAALLLAGRQLQSVVAAGARRIAVLGPWAPVAFVGAYAIAAVALLPGSLLTVAGGAIFGLLRGTVYVFVGATLGACAAFLVARHLARRLVERRIAGNPRFAAIDRAIGREGRRIVFLLRLSPLFPFNLLNYALGLTRVRFGDYLIASLGMLPGTILYVYYGKVAGDVARVLAGGVVHHDASYWVLLGLGLVATIAATALVTRTAKRALAEEVEHAGP